MRNNRHARATIIIVTIAIAAVLTSLFVATMTIAPRQADALSIYDPDAANPDPGNTPKPAPIPTTKPTSPTVPITNCAMDTIESLQSFLSCLGAK
jgi:hypothetical protein